MEAMNITDEERARILPQESLLGVYHEFLKLRMDLKFHQVVGGNEAHEAELSECKTAVYSNCNDGPDYAPLVCALGTEVMKAGRHYVTFSRVGNSLMFPPSMVNVGVIRPIDLSKVDLKVANTKKGEERFQPWDEQHYPALADANKTGGWGEDGKIDYCIYQSNGGDCFFGYWNNPNPIEEEETLNEWPGKGRILFNEDCGLLLDLDEGTLAVYKAGKRLGVIMDGLIGEYSWFVMVFGTGLQMERGDVPPSLLDDSAGAGGDAGESSRSQEQDIKEEDTDVHRGGDGDNNEECIIQ